MRKLIFPAETYVSKPVKDKEGNDTDKTQLRVERKIIGLLELLWTAIQITQAEISKKEHKINKRLRNSIRSVTRYKDSDEDSRITKEGAQQLIIEEDEYELLKKLLENNKLSAKISDELTDLWEVIDSAEQFTPAKAEQATG